MAFFDKDGNEISFSADITDADIRKAFLSAVNDGSISLGNQIGATLSVSGNMSQTNAKTAYDNMLAFYNEKPNTRIPFFISTDQHGRGLQQHRWANNADSDGVNYVNINLGDTVTDTFSPTEITNAYGEIWQVKNYIGVVGNHERKYGTVSIDDSLLNRLFSTTNLLRENSPSPQCCYSVIDGKHSVEYIVVDEYITNANKNNYTAGLKAETMDWLIRHLTDSTLDIVLLKHWFLYPQTGDSMANRNGEVEFAISAYLPQLTQLFVDRKNKANGSITDVDGATHNYDFRNCKTELLCCLHGHQHGELTIKYGGSLRGYFADWYGNNSSCVFGIIDREEKELHIFRYDNTTVNTEWVLTI